MRDKEQAGQASFLLRCGPEKPPIVMFPKWRAC
jgi:hypothetical protein